MSARRLHLPEGWKHDPTFQMAGNPIPLHDVSKHDPSLPDGWKHDPSFPDYLKDNPNE